MYERKGLKFLQESPAKSIMNDLFRILNRAFTTKTSLYQCYISSDNDLYIHLFLNQKLAIHIEDLKFEIYAIADFGDIEVIGDEDLQDFNSVFPLIPKEQSGTGTKDLDSLTSNTASLEANAKAPSSDIERVISYIASSMRHIDDEKEYPILNMLHKKDVIGTEAVFASDQKHKEADFLIDTISIFRANANGLLYFDEIMDSGLKKLIDVIKRKEEDKSVCSDHYSLCYAFFKCSPEPFRSIIMGLPFGDEKLVAHPKLYLFLYFIYMMGLAKKVIESNRAFLRNRNDRHIPAIEEIIGLYKKDRQKSIPAKKNIKKYLEMLNIDYNEKYLSRIDIQNLEFLLSFLKVTQVQDIKNYFSHQICLVFNLLFFNYQKKGKGRERERHHKFVKHPNTILEYFNFQTMGGDTYQSIQLNLPMPYLTYKEINPRDRSLKHISE